MSTSSFRDVRCIFLCPQLRRSWRGILVSGCPCVPPSVRACLCASVRQEPCMLEFWNFIYRKIADTRFFSCPSYLFFWSYASLKQSEWNLMHSISYEPLHARVFKFHIWISHEKIADPYFFLVRVISLSGVMPLRKNQNESLSARYFEKYLN